MKNPPGLDRVRPEGLLDDFDNRLRVPGARKSFAADIQSSASTMPALAFLPGALQCKRKRPSQTRRCLTGLFQAPVRHKSL
jgi:hypothetical protein